MGWIYKDLATLRDDKPRLRWAAELCKGLTCKRVGELSVSSASGEVAVSYSNMLDEPTNDLGYRNRALENALLEFLHKGGYIRTTVGLFE